jgi:hypothetical protein
VVNFNIKIKMMKQIMDLFVILLIALAGLTHIVRLINLFFKMESLSKLKFISNPIPSKSELAAYYILIIGICIYAIKTKL